MNRYDSMIDRISAILIPALMAGCAAHVLWLAAGASISALIIYSVSIITSAIIVQAGDSALRKIISAAILTLAAAAVIVLDIADIRLFFQMIGENGRVTKDITAMCGSAGRSLSIFTVIVFGMLTTYLFGTHTGRMFALILPVASILIALTIKQDIPLFAVIPGIAGFVAAFSGLSYTGLRGIRLPAAIVALVIAVMAVVLVPSQGTTWTPLRKLAERIRSITNDYVRFTEERVAFSINEKGYDHGGMISDTVVTMLGGEADPSDDKVMKVISDSDILLRGTIKSTYTGYSWVDERVKARYLYYDFTHSASRSSVFDSDEIKKGNAFKTVDVSVEMLEPGTSTLFVPEHMLSFDMDLSDAVYYNSVGEIFLTRDVKPGDRYSLKAQLPVSDEQLIAYARNSAKAQNTKYLAMQAEYLGLPDGIDERVYALSASVTQDHESACEKAIALRDYLAQNYKYTLKAGYPSPQDDFVSWFLFQEKKGYCSYFASAMTVMCRAVGIPARYVEGYFIHGSDTGMIVTGHNAHAWTEIYLDGIGWVSIDATASAYGSQYGSEDRAEEASPNSESQLGGEKEGLETPFENDPAEGDTSGDDPQIDEEGSTDPEENDSDEPEEDDGSDSEDNDEQEDETQDEPSGMPEPPDDPGASENTGNSSWVWIVLAILLILLLSAAAVVMIRKRLRSTDPLFMCRQTRSAAEASRILYRATLTLLNQLGYVPMNGETAEAFAVRVCQTIPNGYFEMFTEAVTETIYSGRNIRRSELEAGRDAYLSFLNGMKRTERLRYDIRRIMQGIGDIESIP